MVSAGLLALRDAGGITLAEAIRDFGGDPTTLAAAQRDPAELLGYVEVHIEQGPVLEREGLPIGVVSAIAGQSRFAISLSGVAGHAGTIPMALRHDALCAAAEVILAIEESARATPGLVATVGQLRVEPGASNVVPGQVTFSLDLRHALDTTRHDAIATLEARVSGIADARGIELDWRLGTENAALSCDSATLSQLAGAITAAGFPVRELVSGAGHDAVMLSRLCPAAMLFVRCAGGISHNPAESVTTADVAVALDVLDRYLAELATTSV
jgi:allantoate deiminase